MQHTLFSDGNQKKISWVIQTLSSTIEQKRNHADIYLDKITNEQSKYIALHVAIFWCIGAFIIKNEDTAKIMIDSKSMYENLLGNSHTSDFFIQNKINFIQQLVEQRKLNIEYHLIDSKDNLAQKLILDN